MKNAINYFYNLIIDNIHQTKKYYYFDYNNCRYILIAYHDNPNLLPSIYNLHLKLLNEGIYIHQIILNNKNNIATIINGIPYILMKTHYFIGKINFETVLTFSNILTNNNATIDFQNEQYQFKHNKKINKQNKELERTNLGNLWAIKNDYLEYQINQLGQKHKLLRNSFDYYIGLGETAISLINTTYESTSKTICHKRIKYTDTLFDFYNPLNFIIDGKIRDIAEYLKMKFFSGKNINNDLNKFFTTNQLNTNDHITFLARMIYPTYYFDLFEQIINGKKDDKNIKKITNLSSDYEILLKKIYQYYRKNLNIEPIEWLE